MVGKSLRKSKNMVNNQSTWITYLEDVCSFRSSLKIFWGKKSKSKKVYFCWNICFSFHVSQFPSITIWVYCVISRLFHTQKKLFRDNSNSLTGEAKLKSMRFSLEKNNIFQIRILVTRTLQISANVMSCV